MRCPRRDESVHGMRPGDDKFRSPDNSCTWCGSLNPEEFMRRLETGDVELGPTDKGYKVYVRNRGGTGFKQTYRTDAKPFAGWGSTEHTWVTEDREETKFYFQHLDKAQRDRFIELYNEKRLRLGYPGYFYVMPFFCRVA